jgi:hypothetical protein
MSLAKHGELYFILASTYFSPLFHFGECLKKWFPTLDLHAIDILTGEIAVEVTGVVGASPTS